MTNNLENDNNYKDHVELSNNQILEKIKKDLNPIQENLTEKKITVDEAKSELIKINEWIQGTKLENKDKKEIWKAFEKLIRLEKNIDEISLKNEVIEIIKLLETLTKRDLALLKHDIQKSRYQNDNRPEEVINWINNSSENLTSTIDDASKDSNIIARTVGSRMKKLIS